MAMTLPPGKTRIRRRGALLLIVASLAAFAPLAGRDAMQARADDGGGGGSGSDGGSGSNSGPGSDGGSGSNSGSGSGDGGSSGSDGGSGSDDGGDSHGGQGGGGGSIGGKSGGSTQGSKATGQQQGRSAAQRDAALAVRLKGRIAPINEVETIAGNAIPGEIIDVRLFRNNDLYVYNVKIIQHGGSIYDVRIDAVTRKVLSARER